MKPRTPDHANERLLVTIMVLAACCDGDFTVDELRRIRAIMDCYPYFPNLTESSLRDIAGECLRAGVTDKTLIKRTVTELHIDYHLPALAFAYEVCAADLVIEPEEKHFLRELRRALDISEELTNAFEISIQSRYFASDPADTPLDFPITGRRSPH